MIYQTINLFEEFSDATLTTYVCDLSANKGVPPRPAVVICPGGGYVNLTPREGEPIARKYLSAGFNAFVLSYSTDEKAANYKPLIEVAKAIQYVREHAEEHHSDPDRVFVCGFSAGGHLAASAGVLWNHPAVREALGIDEGRAPEGINRPNGMILCYPVITSGPYAHLSSFKRLCGNREPSAEEMRPFSLELHIDDTTPPAFIWHTCADTGVPVQNSMLFASALIEKGHRPELHIFPDGPHGLSLGTVDTCYGKDILIVPHITPWADLSIAWVNDLF